MKDLHKLRLASLFHIEAGQLIKSNINDLTTANVNLTTDPIIQNYINKLTTDSGLMDLALIQIRKQQETDALEMLDKERDDSFWSLNLQLKVFKKSKNVAEKTAFNTLKIPFNAYKNIDVLNYEAESNAVDNFIIELAKPVYASAISTLNLSGLISQLSTDNAAFKTLFSTRSTTVAGTTHYDAKAIRKTMIANYTAYVGYVLSLTNATEGQPNNAYYDSILDIVNTIRKYYSDMLARREGAPPAA